MRWLLLVAGFFFIILGFSMFFTPLEDLVFLSLFIGISLLASGIVKVISYFSFDKTAHSGWILADGIISTLLGCWVLANGNIIMLTVTLPYIFAIWVLASSVVRFVGSFAAKAAGLTNWRWMLAVGSIGMISGFILMFSPTLAALTLSTCLAWLFIISGISDLVYFFNISKA